MRYGPKFFVKHFLVILSVGLGFKTKILSDSKLVLYFKTALCFTRSCIYWSAFLNLEVSAAAPSALSLISASQAAGPRSKCLGQSGPCEKYVNIPSEKYIYVHKYVYICVYTYLCKMDEYRSYAGLS